MKGPPGDCRARAIDDRATSGHLTEREIGLTRLYNEIEPERTRSCARCTMSSTGRWPPRTGGRRAVVAAYGWPATVAADPIESNRRLLDLNRRIASGELEYAPFAPFAPA